MTTDLGSLSLDGTSIQQGDLLAESEVDIYRFELNDTADISINLIMNETNDDADLEFYRDENNDSIAQSNEFVTDRREVGADFMRLTAQEPGSYLIHVIGFEATGSFDVIGYNLSIRAVSTNDDNNDNNDNNDDNNDQPVPNTINGVSLSKLSPGQTIESNRHEFSPGSNVKYQYRFELEKSGSLQIRSNVLTSGDDVNLELFQETNNNGQLDSDDVRLSASSNSGDDTINIPQISAGNYYLDVPLINNSSDNFLDYQLIFDYEQLNPLEVLDTRFYRYENKAVSETFLFAGEGERPNVLANGGFVDQGYVFNLGSQSADDLISFTRFRFSDKVGTYFYAAEAEASTITPQSNPNFIREGVAFYAYPDINKGTDIFRLRSLAVPGTYTFATLDQAQQLTNNSNNWINEGVAFEGIIL